MLFRRPLKLSSAQFRLDTSGLSIGKQGNGEQSITTLPLGKNTICCQQAEADLGGLISHCLFSRWTKAQHAAEALRLLA